MKKLFALVLTFLVVFFSNPSFVFAVGNLNDALDKLGSAGEEAGVQEASIESYVGSIINAALTMVGIIFLILMVYAGYLWMTAAGEGDQIEKAQEIVKTSIIGIILVMSAYAITAFVISKVESAP